MFEKEKESETYPTHFYVQGLKANVHAIMFLIFNIRKRR